LVGVVVGKTEGSYYKISNRFVHMLTCCCWSGLSTPSFEVPPTEHVSPREILNVGASALISPREILNFKAPELMSSDKLAKQMPEAAAAAAVAAEVKAEAEVEMADHLSAPGKSLTSLLQSPLQEELGLLTVSLNGTFLSPLELLVVACSSRGWCRTVEECSAGLGFADGPFTRALQVESQLMCELLAFDVDFNPRDFSLALLVGAENVDQVPERVAEAVTQVRYLPNVRMPSECPAEAVECTVIPCDTDNAPKRNCRATCGSECHSLSIDKPGARLGGNTRIASAGMEELLRRAWANAYIDAQGNCDRALRKQAFDLLKHWRALWCCGLRTQTISAGNLHVMLPGQSQTHFKETWDLSAVVLTFPSGVVAAAHVSYIQKEKKFPE
jgi:hypothetical protein